MDVVFDAVKKVSTAAKEFIDGTAAQSKNFLIRNAFSTGRLSSDEIRQCLKYGIPYFLLKSECCPLKSVILRTEFTETEKHHFEPGDGILPLNLPAFDMQCNAMNGFRRIMLEYSLTPTMIANSISKGNLREFANPAKSGSLFFLTSNDEYILKTVRDYEAHFFQSDLLNDYYHNLAKRKRSMLARYFGMYAYNQQGSFLTLRFVIMSNIIPSSLPISECFDLKGSTKGRRATPEEMHKARPTYKDLDFIEMHPEGILLPPNMYDRLAEILRDDVEILRGWNIIDYSLLVGIYNLSKPNSPVISGALGALGRAALSTPIETIICQPSPGWNLLSCERAENIRGWNCPIMRMFPDDPSSACVYNDQNAFAYGGIPGMNGKGEKLAIFLGIIDILQTYDVSKQVQNYVQGIQSCDEFERSIIDPCHYAERFLHFILTRVFHRGSTDLGTANITKIFPDFQNTHFQTEESFRQPETLLGTALPYPIPDVIPPAIPSAPPYVGEMCSPVVSPPYPTTTYENFPISRESSLPYPCEDDKESDLKPPPYPPVQNFRHASLPVSDEPLYPTGFRAPRSYSCSSNQTDAEVTPRYTERPPKTPYPVRRPNIPDPEECIRKSITPGMSIASEKSTIRRRPTTVKGMPPLPKNYKVFSDDVAESENKGEYHF